MASGFYERLRMEALRQMEEAFGRGRDAGYTAYGFVHDEPRPEPGSEGPPNRWAVLASLARAKGLLPPIAKGVRLRRFNEAQRRICKTTGPIFDLPCRVVN